MGRELELPYSKLWTMEGPKIRVDIGQIVITYDYVPGNGDKHEVAIQFSKVLAYKYTDESCFSGPLEFMADGVIQLDIDDSRWLGEIKQARQHFFRPGTVLYESYGRDFDFYHFGVWFAEEGVFEVIAETCDIEVLN